ncbi:MAG: OmpA family protein [Chrysiogenetes bacterium]|nr:OmpA family protein [Chrysiogenetes bacterium]
MNVRLIRSALILALLGSVLGGCVWKSDFEALQEKQRNTYEELLDARDKNNELQASNAALQGDLEKTKLELQKKIARLEETLTEQQRESTDRLKKLKTDLEEAKRTGSEQLAALQSEYDAAKTEAAEQIAETETELAAAREAAEAAKKKVEEISGTYEQLVGNLESEIKDKSVRISRLKNELKIDLVDKILFDSGSATVNARGRAVLKKVSDALKQIQDRQIVVEGHTDDRPIKAGPLAKIYPTNWELSAARAVAVVRLLQEFGVKPGRMAAAGYGPYQPLASNKSAEGRSANRRIEILLQPIRIREGLKE